VFSDSTANLRLEKLVQSGCEAKPLTTFNSQRITAFAVSPDSMQLALARGATSSGVVLIGDLK
jgi:hypothetical protein